ncbi:MAG TPA: hypothetical protein VFV70_15395 [Hyphomonadaceae bacterium]|nr:hypothetical protein [Hyphomonadaceae bacterium]
MIDAILLVLFQAAAGAPGDAPQATTTAATEKTAEPEMVCRNEFEPGSRVRKTRICRPKGSDKQQDKTALQRELDRQGDVLPPSPGIGN